MGLPATYMDNYEDYFRQKMAASWLVIIDHTGCCKRLKLQKEG
jgi:hypothetical protein